MMTAPAITQDRHRLIRGILRDAKRLEKLYRRVHGITERLGIEPVSAQLKWTSAKEIPENRRPTDVPTRVLKLGNSQPMVAPHVTAPLPSFMLFTEFGSVVVGSWSLSSASFTTTDPLKNLRHFMDFDNNELTGIRQKLNETYEEVLNFQHVNCGRLSRG